MTAQKERGNEQVIKSRNRSREAKSYYARLDSPVLDAAASTRASASFKASCAAA
jgi:hypothetical protein